MIQPLSLYIHWPFCLAKCPYCDFNSHVREQVEHVRWQKALLRELVHYAETLPNREIVSIFFGGGTPSLMRPELVQALIERARKLWTVSPDCEITLEANPTSVESARLAAFRDAGVTRISMGIQALDDEALGFLGRQHTVNEALHAFETAATVFDRTSFDLIYARPGQSTKQWERELKQALRYAGEHLSLYQLTIEPGTQFYHQVERGALTMPGNDVCADLYQITQQMMEAEGRHAYEISNHARAGAECCHNLAYWRYQDYAGVGPGAHGRISYNNASYATQAIRSPEKWLEAVEMHGYGIESQLSLAAPEIMTELVLMGLRTKQGVDAEYFQQRTGASLPMLSSHPDLTELFAANYLEQSKTHLRATAAGWMVLDGLTARVIQALDAGLEPHKQAA